MYITNTTKTKKVKTKSGNSIWWLLSEEAGVPNYELRYFEIEPDMCTSYGKHPWEHEVFLIKGTGLLKGKDSKGKPFEEQIGAGDAIYIAPNDEHQFYNSSDRPLGFVCVVPKGVER